MIRASKNSPSRPRQSNEERRRSIGMKTVNTVYGKCGAEIFAGAPEVTSAAAGAPPALT
jgi:hypothetical protein